jgi:hypothetical protein
VAQADLSALPRGAWAYWADGDVRRIFAAYRRLAEVSPPRQGLATTDNARFVRYWWEVEPPGFAGERPKWKLYAKGGRFRRWYEAPRHRVNWEDDGREIKQSIVTRYPYLNGKWRWVAKNAAYYGRGGVTYSYLTSGAFSARRLEPGAIFDVAGSSLFPEDPLTLLAVLNSSMAAKLLSVINSTVNFQVGDLAELPVPDAGTEEIRVLAAEAISLRKQMDSWDQTSTDFVAPLDWASAEDQYRAAVGRLADIECRLDAAVCDLYQAPCDANPVKPIEPLDRLELARQWIGYAVGVTLGRWAGEKPADIICAGEKPADIICAGKKPADIICVGKALPRGRVSANGGVTRAGVIGGGVSANGATTANIIEAGAAAQRGGVATRVGAEGVMESLVRLAGETSARQIAAAVGGIDGFLTNHFPGCHSRQYEGRPVIWAFAGRGRTCLLRHDAGDAVVREAIGRVGGSAPEGWRRHIDDGILLNLAPLGAWVADVKLRNSLAIVAADRTAGRYPCSKGH